MSNLHPVVVYQEDEVKPGLQSMKQQAEQHCTVTASLHTDKQDVQHTHNGIYFSRQIQANIYAACGAGELSGDTDPQVDVIWECCCQQWQSRLDESSTECPFAAWRGIEGFAVRIQVASIRNGQDQADEGE